MPLFDDFNTADSGTIGPLLPWSYTNGSLQIVSNAVRGVSFNTYNRSATTNATTSDRSVKLTVKTFSTPAGGSGNRIDVLTHSPASTVISHGGYIHVDTAGVCTVAIAEFSATTFVPTAAGAVVTITKPTAPFTIEVKLTGSTAADLLINGAVVVSRTGLSTFTGANNGFGLYASNNIADIEIEDFLGSGPVTAQSVCGAECGIAVVGTLSGATEHWASVGTTQSVATTGPSPMRSTRCYRFNPSAATSGLNHVYAVAAGSGGTGVMRFYVYFSSFPSVSVMIGALFATDYYGVAFDQPTHSLRAGADTGYAASGFVVSLNTWYRCDVKFVSAATRTVDLSVDGVAQTQYTNSGAALNIVGYDLGYTRASFTGDFYIDDVITSFAPTDFPIGAGTVTGLYPNGDKTNSVASGTGNNGHIWSATTDFAKGTSGATATGAQNVESTSWQSLDNPLTTTAAGSWIADLLGISTEQICWTYTPLPAASAVNGVMQVATTHSASTTANAITIGLAATAVSNGYAVVNSDLSETTITVPVAIVANDFGAAWTPAALDGTKSWFYFSASDVNPDPYLDGVCLEVDYVPQLGRYPHRDVRQAINRGSFY